MKLQGKALPGTMSCITTKPLQLTHHTWVLIWLRYCRLWHPHSHLSDCTDAEGCCRIERELWNMCAWHQSVIITRGATISPASNCLLLSINKSFQITIKLREKIQGRPMGIIENNWACGGFEESPLWRSPEEPWGEVTGESVHNEHNKASDLILSTLEDISSLSE